VKKTVFYLLILISCSATARVHGKFSLHITGSMAGSPVCVNIDWLNYNTDKGEIALFELTPEGELFIPSQLETGVGGRLWFIPGACDRKGGDRIYVIKMAEETVYDKKQVIEIERGHKDLKVISNNRPVLNYRFAMTYPPEGVDLLYKRSGYIHPLWSPGGELLTSIQPSDHYHHYGIWGPWTLTHIDGRETDFWNLVKGEGTVRFAGFISQVEGEVYTGFKVLQQHIDFGAAGEDRIAINELLDVRVWNVSDSVWIIDYTTTFNTPLKNGIMLDAYRYGGGIGFRATEKWHKDNSTVVTSENKERSDADGSFARWCIVEGESAGESERSGILFMSHPANRMHPEPMRVWPSNANGGRGDIFFEFVPIRHNEWKLERGRDYTLKYRLVVFDGKLDNESANNYWQSFAGMPKIKIL
jgi:hypothetical protein